MRLRGTSPIEARGIQFSITCKLGKIISVSRSYWRVIAVIKHPSIAKKQSEVQEVLHSPDEIRHSTKGEKVFLYYRKYGARHLCVVVRHQNGKGFVITAYMTKKIKEGIVLWRKN